MLSNLLQGWVHGNVPRPRGFPCDPRSIQHLPTLDMVCGALLIQCSAVLTVYQASFWQVTWVTWAKNSQRPYEKGT